MTAELHRNDLKTGEPLNPEVPAKTVKTELLAPEDEIGKPDEPINDARIEDFLAMVVEDAVNSTDEFYYRYRQCKFPGDAPERILKSRMRCLLMKPRVRERLKFLRDAEWELNQPTLLGISKEFKDLIDQSELRPADKINALNSLAKLTGLFDGDKSKRQTQVAIVFNSQETPKVDVHVKD